MDICVGNMSAYLNSVVQIGFKQNDFTGALGRSLTKALARYRLMDDYWHGKALSDASWMMFRSMYTNGAWTDILLGKLPPYPPTDSVARWKFQPIPVKLTPPPGLAVDNAIIQFGYAENGSSRELLLHEQAGEMPGDVGHGAGDAFCLSLRRRGRSRERRGAAWRARMGARSRFRRSRSAWCTTRSNIVTRRIGHWRRARWRCSRFLSGSLLPTPDFVSHTSR